GAAHQRARRGDLAWAAGLARQARVVRGGVQRFHRRLVKSAGDGAVAVFSGRARGTEAARWILDSLPGEDLHARAGVHVGEIELQGDDIAGLAVHISARIMGLAEADEVLVSRTVRDLTAGS